MGKSSKSGIGGGDDFPAVPKRPGLSGPELIASIPDPTLKEYIARYDAEHLKDSFESVGIHCKHSRNSIFGIGHVTNPGTIDMAIRDGELYALLPGKHAYRTHCLQPKPYSIDCTIHFSEGDNSHANGWQGFEGGIIITLGPSEVGFAYNMPGGFENADMGKGVALIPPGTWIIRNPILVAKANFEVTTNRRNRGGVNEPDSYIQELKVGVMDVARPRLVYVPYNHSAMFINGNQSMIAEQGFHWANPGVEIAGPWPAHEQRFTHTIKAKTLDNMWINIEAECWVQMVNPEKYVRVAGKDQAPQQFVQDKLTAKVKQHVAQINALQLRATEVQDHDTQEGEDHNQPFDVDAAMGVPVAGQGQAEPGPSTGPVDEDAIIVTAAQDAPTEFQVFDRMKDLLDEVRGFVDGRESSVVTLAGGVQEAIGRAGLHLVSLAALSVNLPSEIAAQIQQANEEQIIAQTEQATNHAKAQKHIAAKYAEIRKKKADREEETKDAENQVTLQRSKARLAEAEEFAKRQAKRAEQKVQQNLELQALEHNMVREQTRIDNELAILEKETALLARQKEIEEIRLDLGKKIQARKNLEADVKAYQVKAAAVADREKVNQQTLVEAVMSNLGQPLEGAKVVTINGGAGGDGENGGGMNMLPAMVALREILGATNAQTEA